MERKEPYRPGTIVTLKDGNRYRTSRITTYACYDCIDFYGGCTNCPCVKEAFIKFAFPPLAANRTVCCQLYGEFTYPKLITTSENGNKEETV